MPHRAETDLSDSHAKSVRRNAAMASSACPAVCQTPSLGNYGQSPREAEQRDYSANGRRRGFGSKKRSQVEHSRTEESDCADEDRCLQSLINGGEEVEEDAEYEPEENNGDEPEAQNLHVVQRKDDVVADEDEDLLCIDKEIVDVEKPCENRAAGEKDSKKQTGAVQSQGEEYDEEEYDEEDEKESNGSADFKNEDDDPEKGGHSKSANRKVQGIAPKDLELKKELLSFIAYPPNLESACKLLSQNKTIALQEGPAYNKNRIFVSGTSIMSTKLTVSLAQSRRLCEELQRCEVRKLQVKKANFLDKKERVNAT